MPPTVPREPKRMLEVRQVGDTTQVAINFSSLALLQDCMRKGQYAFSKGLQSVSEAEALRFGTAVHKALEVWYCAPRDSRRKATRHCDDLQDYLSTYQEAPAECHHGACVRCATVAAFCLAGETLRYLPDDDKRSIRMGVRLLNAYMDHYADDPYVVAIDAQGPLCERSFEQLMHTEPGLSITYHGQIDVVLRNEVTGELVVADHKTSSSLGQDFLNRVRPNHQYTGYVWAARHVLGLPAQTFMVNGLQVAKTKVDFKRQLTTRDEADFAELHLAVVDIVERWIKAERTGRYPQTTIGPCAVYGGCTYRQLCEAPAALRPTLERNLYNTPQEQTQ